ncbi:MAG: inlA 5 [Planctomycetaceae bacterium]|nr:inlA 5 [Planctomycetaceae bacterium]
MSEPEVPKLRGRSRWEIGLVGMLALGLLMLGLMRLAYPAFRQRQIIAQLAKGGLKVDTDPLFIRWCPAWLNSTVDEFLIEKASLEDIWGTCTDSDLALMSELIGWTYDDLDGEPSCVIHLENSKVTDEGLSVLRELRNLSGLWVQAKGVTDAGIAHLSGLSLFHLNLTGTSVTDAGLDHLKSMTSLGYLDLSETRITDAGLVHLTGLSALESLNLNDTRITAAGLPYLATLKNLKYLHLGGTRVRDDSIPELIRMTNLDSLDLSRTEISAAGIGKVKAVLIHTIVFW